MSAASYTERAIAVAIRDLKYLENANAASNERLRILANEIRLDLELHLARMQREELLASIEPVR